MGYMRAYICMHVCLYGPWTVTGRRSVFGRNVLVQTPHTVARINPDARAKLIVPVDLLLRSVSRKSAIVRVRESWVAVLCSDSTCMHIQNINCISDALMNRSDRSGEDSAPSKMLGVDL
jgi:hypothetical protein